MRIPKTNFRKVVFMTRAQEIRKERMEFLWSGKNLEALSLYHSVLDLLEEVKFNPHYTHITVYSFRGMAHLTARETLYKRSLVPCTQNNLVDFIELFKAEDGYDAYWSDKEGNKKDTGPCVTVVMDEN